MNAQVGNFEIPLTGRELLTALRDGKPVQIGRAILEIGLAVGSKK